MSKVNKFRATNGRPPLTWDKEAGRVSRYHSCEMAKAATPPYAIDDLFHTTSGQIYNRLTNWNTFRENVGMGGTVDGIFEALKNSTTHRANMLATDVNFRRPGLRRKTG